MLTSQQRQLAGVFFRLSWLVLITGGTLSSCTTYQETTPPVAPAGYQQARSQALQLNDPALRAQALSAAARDAPTRQRQRILLESAEQWLKANQTKKALALAKQLDFVADQDEWLLRRQLLIARAQLSQGNPLAAKSALGFVHQLQLSAEQLAPVRELLATLDPSTGTTMGELASWINQLSITQSGAERRTLQTRILGELRQMPLTELQQPPSAELADQVTPWIQLALISRSDENPLQRLDQVTQWQAQYPLTEVDATLLEEIYQPRLSAGNLPVSVALLLPYSGELGKAGRRLHSGIMNSYFGNALAPATMKLISFDTGEGTAVTELYRQAENAGADFVIGPLKKAHIVELIDQSAITLPTLALNHVESDRPLPPELLQLGLSPENEIRQLSRLAWALGHRRAASFYTSEPLGARLAEVFAQSWAALGGSIAVSQEFPAERSDFSTEIQALLGLDASQARKQKLARALNDSLQFTPRRRQDIDFLFLVSFPDQARAIRPQLRFHQADDLPVFASSHLYSGNPDQERDKDLNQVRLCDTPQTFSPLERKLPLPSIHALGEDAFALLPYLNSLRTSRLRTFNGATGTLTVGTDGRINTRLRCGRFRRGLPVEIPAWH